MRLVWSLALGRRPAEIFRFWWYRLAFFRYWASSFLRRVSMSFLLALVMIDAMALLHSDGMFSAFGGFVRCSMVEACVIEGVSGGAPGWSL